MEEINLNDLFSEEDSIYNSGNSFMVQDFKNSGINYKTIKKYQDMEYIEETDDYWKLYYPELYEDRITNYWNIRYKNPDPQKGKYVKPKGQTSRLFRPLDLSPDVLRNPKKAIILTEGDKKAIKAVQEGFPCLSLGGVWSWKRTPDKELEISDVFNYDTGEEIICQADIIPDIANANFENKEIFLCYDNDMWSNEKVKQALYSLAAYLIYEKKAKVKIIILPKGDAKGLDDYLIANGAEQFKMLMEQAKTVTLKDIRSELSEKSKPVNFPLEFFPPKISELIKDLHVRMDAPIEYIASVFISVISILIDGHYTIMANSNSNWVEYPILWIAIVGTPSQKKSPCLKLGKEIIDDLEICLNGIYEINRSEYKRQVDFRKLTINKLKKQAKKYETININDIPPEPEEPLRARLTTQNTTTESLAYIVNANSSMNLGVAFYLDELSYLLKSFNQYKRGGNDIEYYLQAWSRAKQNIVRKSSKTDYTIEIGHNIIGSIQPKVLQETLLKQGLELYNGMVERWLFCCSDYNETGFSMDSDTDYDISLFINFCRELFSEIISNPNEKTLFEFSSQARATFLEFCNAMVEVKKSAKLTDLDKSYFQKQTNYVARFALIHNCFSNYKDKVISEVSVIKAIKLSKYFINCYKNIIRNNTLINSIDERTINYLVTKDIDRISPTQLYKNNESLFKSKDMAKNVLERLSRKGYGRISKAKNGLTFIFYNE